MNSVDHKGFLMFLSHWELLSELPPAMFKRVMQAIFSAAGADCGMPEDMELVERIAFTALSGDVQRSLDKYDERRRKCATAGSKGGRRKAENAAEAKSDENAPAGLDHASDAGNGAANASDARNNVANCSDARNNVANYSDARNNAANCSDARNNVANASDARNDVANASDARNGVANGSDARNGVANGSDARNNVANASDARNDVANCSDARNDVANASDARNDVANCSDARNDVANCSDARNGVANGSDARNCLANLAKEKDKATDKAMVTDKAKARAMDKENKKPLSVVDAAAPDQTAACAAGAAPHTEAPPLSAAHTEPSCAQPSPRAVNAHFEALWALYPIKRGKNQVSKRAKRQLMSVDTAAMQTAIARYVAEVEASAFDRQWLNGSTWFNGRYLDYLGEGYAPPPVSGSKPSARSRETSYRSAEEASACAARYAALEE